MNPVSSALISALLAAAFGSAVLGAAPAFEAAFRQPEPHRHEGAGFPPPRGIPERNRLMTDEVARLQGGMAGIRELASQGNLEALGRELQQLEGGWRAVRTELELRQAAGIIRVFEETLASLGQAVTTKNHLRVTEELESLSAALDEAVRTLETVEVDGARLLWSLSLGGLVWFCLSFFTVKVMKARKVKL